MAKSQTDKSNPVTEKNIDEPLMQLPLVAVLLAIVAGSMDGYTYFFTNSYATFQSGNIILFGYTLATGDMDKFLAILTSILSFGIGCFVTAIVRIEFTKRGKVWTFSILIFEIVILLLLSIHFINYQFERFQVAWILSFLAGMQGNAFHKIDGQLYGNVAVTLNVQLAFNYLAETFFNVNKLNRRHVFNKCLNFFTILAGFAAGAFLSAIITPYFDSYALLITVFGLIGIVCIVWTLHREYKDAPIDSD